MKVLVTGRNGYVGGHLTSYLNREGYTCQSVSVRNEPPDFTGYDVVVHAAALAHEKPRDPQAYFDVNAALAEKLAGLAKAQGVKQFIFLSCIEVYGSRKNRMISPSEIPAPETLYAKSKLVAEMILRGYEDINFSIAYVRAPMVYGPECPGLIPAVGRWLAVCPLFPKTVAQRSVIHVENLCALIRLLIDHRSAGVFCPQENYPIRLNALAQTAAERAGKRIHLSRPLGWLVETFKWPALSAMFGDYVYKGDETEYFDLAYLFKQEEDWNGKN